MNEILGKLFYFINGIWRFKWHMVIVSWILAISSWALIINLPDQWEVKARVYVEKQSMLTPLLQGIAINSESAQRIDFMTRTLLSRPNLEKVVRMTDMDLQVKNEKDMEELINKLTGKIRVKGTGKANLYTITYESDNAQLAKRVVQSLLNIFVEDTLGANRRDTDIAQQFLEQQIREYETRLIQAEDRLKQFKRKNVGMMPGQGGGYYQRMEAAQSQLRQVQLDLREAEIRRDELKRQLKGTTPTQQIQAPPRRIRRDEPSPTALLDQRIAGASQQLDSLLLKYTDIHPDVEVLKQQIAALEKQRQEKLKSLKPVKRQLGELAPNAQVNPAYQEMKVALAEAEAELASLRVRGSEFERRVASLQELVDTVPQVEAELARLNRDYSVNQRQYNALLNRLEQARISQEADQSSDNVKFKIIDPPRVPLVPTGPNRPLFLITALVFSILAGAALSIVMTIIRPVFDSRRMLMDITGLPVLGSVTMIPPPGEATRNRLVLAGFVTAFGLLFVIFITLMGFTVLGPESLKSIPVLGRFI